MMPLPPPPRPPLSAKNIGVRADQRQGRGGSPQNVCVCVGGGVWGGVTLHKYTHTPIDRPAKCQAHQCDQ